MPAPPRRAGPWRRPQPLGHRDTAGVKRLATQSALTRRVLGRRLRRGCAGRAELRRATRAVGHGCGRAAADHRGARARPSHRAHRAHGRRTCAPAPSSARSATAPSLSRWTSYLWWHAWRLWCPHPGKTKCGIQAYWHRHILGVREWYPREPEPDDTTCRHVEPASETDTDDATRIPEGKGCRYWPWRLLKARTFGAETTQCRDCKGTLKLRALAQDPDAIKRILTHLGLQGLFAPWSLPSASVLTNTGA